MIPRYSRPEMVALWTDESRFQLWLEIETLALEAMVKEGIAPQEALDEVKAKATFNTERVLEIESKVKHDVIAFLTNVAENVGDGARYLHFGMTSSDLLDTCFAVQLKRATEKILAGLTGLKEAIKKQAHAHKNTVCVGRSHGIHAEPTTFGLKCAIWFDEMSRHEERIQSALKDISVGAISGPVGTFAHIPPSIEEYVCEKLDLKPAPASSQIIQRDRHAALFSSFALVASSIEKISVEIRHLQRTEVREAEEFFSKGQKGSSAMPHKRNPVLTENITGLARLIRSWSHAAQENITLWHERDISHSSVERVVAPDSTVLLDFMIARMTGVMEKLVVYPENMQKNLDLTGGLVHSGTLLVMLAAKGLSREDSYALVQSHAMEVWESINTGSGDSTLGFEEKVRSDTKITSLLSEEELKDAFSLDRHLKHVDYIFNRVFG